MINNKLLKFLISGGTAALVEYGLFLLIHNIAGPDWIIFSQTISFIAGFAISFLLNKSWVFGSKGHASKQLLQYATLAGVNLLLGNIVIIFITEILNFEYFIAKLVVMILVVIWNYLIFSKIIFKPTDRV